MTDQPEISVADLDPERPEEMRSLAQRLAGILRGHRQDPDDPDSSCLCGYHGNYYGHVARETLVDLRTDGWEVRRAGRIA